MTIHTAIFRCDSGPGIGLGHLMRCLALAEELRDIGWQVGFASRTEQPEAAARGFAVNLLPADVADEPEALGCIHPTGLDLLIVDHYRRDALFERRCRAFARRIVVIDDLPMARQHACDLLVDPAPGRIAAQWSSHAPGAQALVGVGFALLRQEIVARRRQDSGKWAARRPLLRVLISFGASDSRNATAIAATACRAFDDGLHIEVIAFPSFPHLAELVRLAPEIGFELLIAPNDYLDRLGTVDLVIGAGGMTAVENACLGVPALLIETHEGQHDNICALVAAGAARTVGALGEDSAGRLVAELAWFRDADRRLAMSQAAMALVDGCGAARMARQLHQLMVA